MKLEFIKKLATEMRKAILPQFGKFASKESEKNVAKSGDTTFKLDTIAEDKLFEFLEKSDFQDAYYSEDRGLIKFSENPKFVLVVDPIDGTRSAVCGLESSVISIGAANFTQNPKFKDLILGVILEIKTSDIFWAEKGKGSFKNGIPLKPNSHFDLKKTFWAFETVGRPYLEIAKVLAPLVKITSIEAGVFLFSSSAFSLTRIATGQFDAYLDVSARLLKENPNLAEKFKDAGNGKIITVFPYDIAAAKLILEEAGGIVTDAFGNSIEEEELLTNPNLSLLVASNKELHNKILELLDF